VVGEPAAKLALYKPHQAAVAAEGPAKELGYGICQELQPQVKDFQEDQALGIEVVAVAAVAPVVQANQTIHFTVATAALDCLLIFQKHLDIMAAVAVAVQKTDTRMVEVVAVLAVEVKAAAAQVFKVLRLIQHQVKQILVVVVVALDLLTVILAPMVAVVLL
jgi:hypothetical protein